MVEFIYQGKTYYAAVLETKLKRMKITLDDIKIVDKPEKKMEMDSKEYMIHWDPKTNETYWQIVTDDIRKTVETVKLEGDAFVIFERMNGRLWNAESKTGIGDFYDEEYVKSLKLLNGIPVYPITLGKDGMPILEA